MINKILFITLSNIGDVILTLPALDSLRQEFPQSKITVMAGPRPQEIFQANPYIHNLIIYDKYAPLRKKIKLFFLLAKEHFDLVVDLRNTLYGALLPARFRTSPFLCLPRPIRHKKEQYLYRLQRALNLKKVSANAVATKSLFINQQDKDYVSRILEKNNIRQNDKIVIIASAAGGANRRWEKEKFTQVAEGLSEDYRVILVGRESDKLIGQYIYENCKARIFDFTGLTTLKQLACLIQMASLVIVCDTGVLQLASYLDVPILALFGASDEKKYGPWSHKKTVISRELFCRRCQEAQCRFGTLDCMRFIKAEDVFREVRNLLVPSAKSQIPNPKLNFKRILIVRTDRIGDVLLSTPVIKTLRDNYPQAYIAMMVNPYAKDIVEGNPYLDEVIVYDKGSLHKNWFNSARFALRLKRKKFDLSIILHPTNRIHLITFFAGIPKRIGYDLKAGFLLTDKIKHTKQLGEKHELEYNLDLVRYLGIKPQDKDLYIPKNPGAERWAEELLLQERISPQDKLLAIHPGASCPSKLWPNANFSELADRLVDKYGFKVLVLAGPKDMQKAETVVKNMRHPAINLGGKTSVLQLASILRRCILFISNDSGPVHVSSAVGTPVISLFGRAQKGLSPKRWGPLGQKSRFLHKEVGCIECLAHNCKKEFACLKAITVEEVIAAAQPFLEG